jgi:hypothetical protein
MYGRNYHFGAGIDGIKTFCQCLTVEKILIKRVIRYFFHPVQVGSRTKGTSPATQDDYACFPVAGNTAKEMKQLMDHFPVDRIVYFGPVKPDGDRMAFFLQVNG